MQEQDVAFPINYSFVSTSDLDTDEGKLTVLILDKKANQEYWKRMNCFSAQINELNLSGPEDAAHWTITETFAEHQAVKDLAIALYPFLKDQVEDVPVLEYLTELYGIPVKKALDDIGNFLSLTTKDGVEHVNYHW
jgi:hypothetical protein